EEILDQIPASLKALRAAEPDELTAMLQAQLFKPAGIAAGALAGLRHHPLLGELIQATDQAAHLHEISLALFPQIPSSMTRQEVTEYVEYLIAYVSLLRAEYGREAVGVETHLWVRELSRLDAAVDTSYSYRWSDDGVATEESRLFLPAIFCRHCGKLGWGAMVHPNGSDIDVNANAIRYGALTNSTDFLPMMYGAGEADLAFHDNWTNREVAASNLRFFHTTKHEISQRMPTNDDPDLPEGRLIPVLVYRHDEVRDMAGKRACPACATPDSIRFVGSRIATLTSVAVTNLFGTKGLDADEKKALIFTDSVQDAAHRAGYIQTRTHTFTLRTLLRDAMESGEVEDLPTVVENALRTAAEMPGEAGRARRYNLIAPELVERNGFREFWDPNATQAMMRAARRRVLQRLKFDAFLEFGLQARLGRTLELTGTMVCEVDIPAPQMLWIAKKAYNDVPQMRLDEVAEPSDAQFLAWVRGVLVRMRVQGGIYHDWLDRYLQSQGRRWQVWGGRKRDAGMPAFPAGRPAPAFPAVGSLPRNSEFDPVTARSTWYAQWASRCLGIPSDEGGQMTALLLATLASEGFLTQIRTDGHSTVYALRPETLLVSVPTDDALQAGRHTLECLICHTPAVGPETTISQLDGAPCFQARCPGTLTSAKFAPNNYFRQMYQGEMKRVVAREHTSMLPQELRHAYEAAFRGSDEPGAHISPADPNVLVATPTLEMGIDIGDLSCVMLASMPGSVASYVQRVGRAGRKTGNALVLAFVRGRGLHLPKLYDPLSVINGAVTPPTTFVDAEEILARQFTASVADVLARRGEISPKRASLALKLDGEDGYLRRLVDLVASEGEELLTAFLTQFGNLLSAKAIERLKSFALREFSGRMQRVAAEYQRDREDLAHRTRQMIAGIEVVKEEERDARQMYPEDSAEVKEAERNVKFAVAQVKRMQRLQHEMRAQFGIGALESYGVLPNYTLMSDTVELDLQVQHRDQDTQEFEIDRHSYERSSGIAIHEFAPGAVFYASGMEIRIDAAELGPDERDVAVWQICPACTWHQELVGSDGTTRTYRNAARSCPRCGASGIHDSSNLHEVLLLRKVSAVVSRDEAVISDITDERRQRQFTIAALADIDLAYAEDPWQLDACGFGVDYLRRIDLTWLNFGPHGGGSHEFTIGGRTFTAQRFPLCGYCGQLDPEMRFNQRDHHRYWCKYRNADEEHTLRLLLARKLTTQAVKLTLPTEAISAGDFSLPTLQATLLLGLQHHIGGTPGHLQIMDMPDPKKPEVRCLLLHDSVPGGTGYLAAFKDPRIVFEVLKAAWDIVSTCSCEHEDRRACHRCLYPYAHPQQRDKVSRIEAMRMLKILLQLDEDHPEPDFMRWQVRFGPVQPATGESPLEQQFRAALLSRLAAKQAEVVAEPTPNGDLLNISMSGRRWRLSPQVNVEGTRPDFLLRADDPNIPPIAIYTDGYQYHATAAHNRVGDDAEKRARLRASGFIPWAITHQDVENFAARSSSKAWQRAAGVDDQTLERLIHHGADQDLVRAISEGTMALLWQWMLKPEPAKWELFSRLVPFFAFNQHNVASPSILEDKLEAQLGEYLRSVASADTTPRVWGFNLPHLRFIAATLSTDGARSALILDDDAVSSPHFRGAWRTWLLWQTLTAFTPNVDDLLVATTSTLGELLPDSVTLTQPAAETATISDRWREIIEEEALDDEVPFFQALAEADVDTPDSVGDEIHRIATIATWDGRLIVTADETEKEQLRQANLGVEIVHLADVQKALNALGERN
ncbi:MAG: helicase-related protein, partial [Bowdeniella nasicola]|nr:helicase-related protein [Bowdeniella nasicola]